MQRSAGNNHIRIHFPTQSDNFWNPQIGNIAMSNRFYSTHLVVVVAVVVVVVVSVAVESVNRKYVVVDVVVIVIVVVIEQVGGDCNRGRWIRYPIVWSCASVYWVGVSVSKLLLCITSINSTGVCCRYIRARTKLKDS